MLGAPSSAQKALCSRLLKMEKILGEGRVGGRASSFQKNVGRQDYSTNSTRKYLQKNIVRNDNSNIKIYVLT